MVPTVSLKRLDEANWEIQLELPAQARPRAGDLSLVEIELDYDAQWSERRWLAGGLRRYVLVRPDRGSHRRFGLPGHQGRAVFPVWVAEDGSSSTRLTCQPESACRLSVSLVAARYRGLNSEVEGFPLQRLMAANWSDEHFLKGIARDGQSFRVSDATDLVGIAPGTELCFTSGCRRVRSIQGEVVSLRDGA